MTHRVTTSPYGLPGMGRSRRRDGERGTVSQPRARAGRCLFCRRSGSRLPYHATTAAVATAIRPQRHDGQHHRCTGRRVGFKARPAPPSPRRHYHFPTRHQATSRYAYQACAFRPLDGTLAAMYRQCRQLESVSDSRFSSSAAHHDP